MFSQVKEAFILAGGESLLSLHLVQAGETGACKFTCYCVFVDAVCVCVCLHADASSEVSERRAVGPHGLSETDRISISLAGGLYSSMGKSVCVWGGVFLW